MMKTAFLSLCLALLFPSLLRADDVIFFKNCGKYTMYVWVNGSYQGKVNGGATVYMPREGFVTQDSGFQPDGTLKTTHSHGGWEAGRLLEYQAFSSSFEMEGSRAAYYTTGTVPYQPGDKSIGLTCGENPPPAILPTDHEMETAGKMRGGKPPGDLRALLSAGKEEVPYGGGNAAKGSITGNSVFPLWYAGYKKKEEKKEPSGTFTNSLGMKMIWVKPGAVQGRAWEWDRRQYRDGGVRMLQVNGYFLSATETTQAQWAAVMGGNPSQFRGNNLPVEQVSWNDAAAFCQRLTASERQAGKLPKGFVYALPTESQWEYACRAGTTGDYAGNLDAMAWYDRNSGKRTQPVATKQANVWGFHDMHGNVWEWCRDVGHCRDGIGGRSGRGGSWYSSAESCRSGNRNWITPDNRNFDLGIRPALVPSQ